MRNKTFKKVLVTVLATVLMATSIAPTTVEASSKKDKTKPTVQVKVAGTSKYKTIKKKKMQYYNKTIRIKAYDKSGIEKVQVKYTYWSKKKRTEISSTKTYKRGTITLTKEGEYKITATDNNGNRKVVNVIIDKKKPTITVKDFSKQYGTVFINVVDETGNLSGALDYVLIAGRKIKIDGHQYCTGVYSSDFGKGTHTIVAYDKAGNKTTKTFTIK